MTTMKSLEKRLNIPEPDLTRYQSEKTYRFLKRFPFERLLALRELYRDADEAGRTPTVKEAAAALGRSTEQVAAAFGISTAPKATTKAQSERNATPVGGAAAANHDREAAKAAVTRPTRRRPRGSKEDKGK
jgi:hypothetical protein